MDAGSVGSDETSVPLEPGSVLVAVPVLHDRNFYRSVVLICDHDEDGSFGLVLNREIELQPGQLLEELAAIELPLRLGGPVQPDTLHFIHDLGSAVEGAIELTGHLWWGGAFDDLKTCLSEDDFKGQVRFFLGYSGWGSGQLEEEIAEGSWVVCSARAPWVFRPDPDGLWRDVMLSLGGEWALMANYPDDPRVN